jgi:hypothetical protein
MASFKIKIVSCYSRILLNVLSSLLLWTLAVRGGEYKDGGEVYIVVFFGYFLCLSIDHKVQRFAQVLRKNLYLF